MEKFVHSIGDFGTACVCMKSGQLSIICKDSDAIHRVFCSGDINNIGNMGRGWSLAIPENTHGKMVFSQGRLKSYTDVRGKSFGFFYSGGLLSGIVCCDGIITYDYNADGMLTGVIYPDGARVHISYSDVFTIHDITLADSDGNGVCAVSYMPGFDGRTAYVYEYGYSGRERVERRFTDLSEHGRVLTLCHNNDLLVSN